MQLDAVSPLAIEGLVLEIVAQVSRLGITPAQPPSWLRRARNLLNDQFRRGPSCGKGYAPRPGTLELSGAVSVMIPVIAVGAASR